MDKDSDKHLYNSYIFNNNNSIFYKMSKTFREKIVIVLLSCIFTFITAFATLRSEMIHKKADIDYVDKQDNDIKEDIKDLKNDYKEDVREVKASLTRIENYLLNKKD